MREARFIKENKERWQEMQNPDGKHPDETAKAFIELVEDLGYSKTFYPGSKISSYINELASRYYLFIYRNSKQGAGRFAKLIKLDIPLLMYQHRFVLLFSFLLFALFCMVGFFSASQDPTFIRSILGDGYVDMTKKNISEGKPFAVYGQGNELLSFLGIFVNNIRVALYEFAGGILLGIPTAYILVYNSIMVGSFEQMFFAQGLGAESLLTIMVHGTIELSTFVISATAGFVLAKSWLFPGRGSRLQALRRGAKEGLIITMSNFPLLLIAGFIEGFFTRYANMPVWLKLLFIIGSLVLIIGYFIVYPYRIAKKVKQADKQRIIS
jgi:uncharacterized membrane protein SpoIIM required for sporulation